MIDIKQRIAKNLDTQFAAMGFAVPGVDALREGADVSLRTLYKYYPSREAMVIGALEHRNETYLEWITGGPTLGADHVLHIFNRLGDWQSEVSCNGSLFLNALAAYPESVAIRQTVGHHKEQVRLAFEARLRAVAPNVKITELSLALLTIHEGQTEMAMIHDKKTAINAALLLARALLKNEDLI
jgi:AcrR family transcriptional regulator